MNDKTSSLYQYSYNANNCIKAYEHSNYRGQKYMFCSPRYKEKHSVWNDKITSISIPSGKKVHVCHHVGHDSKGRAYGKPPCRSYFKSVSNVGDFMNDKISFIQFANFNSNDYSIIFGSDTQLYWECNTSECRNRVSGETNQGNLSNDWHRRSMTKLAGQIGFGKFAGVVLNGDLTAFGHPNEITRYKHYWENNFALNLWPGLGNHDYANNMNDCWNNRCAPAMVNYLNDRVRSMNRTGFDWSVGNTYYRFPMRRRQHKGSLVYSWDIGKYHFVQLNNYPTYQTTFNTWNYGSARRDYYDIKPNMTWLKNDLNRAKRAGKKIILNMHDPGEYFTWEDRKRFYDQLKDYPILAIFAGHAHSIVGYSYWSERIGNRYVPIVFGGSAGYNEYVRANFKSNRVELYVIEAIEGRVDVKSGPTVLWHDGRIDRPHRLNPPYPSIDPLDPTDPPIGINPPGGGLKPMDSTNIKAAPFYNKDSSGKVKAYDLRNIKWD
jgi:cytolysin (calcineurin-like family phosphatase)